MCCGLCGACVACDDGVGFLASMISVSGIAHPVSGCQGGLISLVWIQVVGLYGLPFHELFATQVAVCCALSDFFSACPVGAAI